MQLKPFTLLLLIITVSVFSQESKTMPARAKGEVFKSRPTRPNENLNKSGLVVVEKRMYGIYFIDNQLNDTVKERVRKFFRERYNGFTELKKYELKIEKRGSDWYIDNKKVPE
jgi:hypothetical protein